MQIMDKSAKYCKLSRSHLELSQTFISVRILTMADGLWVKVYRPMSQGGDSTSFHLDVWFEICKMYS